jgi:hypothetical protein
MRLTLCLLFLLLTACQQEEKVEAPTAAETDRLDNAEAMLNSLANEEGAAPESTAPSTNSD